jgi:hypothetical protein
MNGRKPSMIGLAAGIACCAALGCATTSVKTDHDPTANFPKYRTFTVAKTKVVTDGESDPNNTLVADRINAAIQDELMQKGLKPAAQAQPDLLVAFTAGNRTRRELDGVWMSYGWYVPAGDGNDVWIDETHEGTLVIDFIDANTRKLVWRSVAKVDDQMLVEPDVIEKAVDKALKKFPTA